MMANLPLMKLQATGNDFVFADARTPLPGEFAKMDRTDIVRKVCDRHFGIGADGMVFVEEAAGRFRWDFYNTDGSQAEMCGNATRCMGRWASLKMDKPSLEFQTIAGKVKVEIRGDLVASYLEFVNPTFEVLPVVQEQRSAILTNTGVPHAVVRLKRIEDAEQEKAMIAALRFHPTIGPRGANITFLEEVSDDEFKTVTFERGVEGFTLACGTGVIAAAAVGLKGGKKLSAKVHAPGGELLVEFGTDFKGVTLIGPAKRIFETSITEEFMK